MAKATKTSTGDTPGKPPRSPRSAPTPDPAETTAAEAAPPPAFPIVGIGASAGGLAAFEAFFSGMPTDQEPGMAFILVQHLAPDHKSLLSDLIGHYTRMDVLEVVDDMVVQPNCAYIIPPNRDMAFLAGTLQLLEPASVRGQRRTIDFFFRSLAHDLRERAICIVLSGTGSDGTVGLQAIKEEGGMVMVQDPATTAFDGMPRSAIATGLVDFVLPPAEMPARLLAWMARPGQSGQAARPGVPHNESALKKIFVLLRVQTGHDFSQYKPSTVQRRIERRMAVHRIEGAENYVAFLQQNPGEAEALFRDLLIGVTSFFRDPDAFRTLETAVIPALFEGKPDGALIRVWCAGCSTGEEAYSLAMLLAEAQESIHGGHRVQIFATDIDSQAVATARAGLYPAAGCTGISPERLERHFSAEIGNDRYRIRKNIRDLLVFSEQDVIKDPPFSRLDLIACRNLLIYMSAGLQRKLIPLFHYALNPGGYLFLGGSESLGESSDLYATVDRHAKLFQRKEGTPGAKPATMDHRLPLRSPLEAMLAAGPGRPAGSRRVSPRERMEKALLQHLSPAAALVDEQGNILYLHGGSGRYLELLPGEISSNILKLSRPGLRRELTKALRKAVADSVPVTSAGLRVQVDGVTVLVDLCVSPLTPAANDEADERQFLVTLQEPPSGEASPVPGAAVPGKGEHEKADPGKDPRANPDGASSPAPDARVEALTRALLEKEETLKAASEELETANEELKSSNEEMQSVNEEMQSTNEELETSKEELQSVNEELATVNAELQAKVGDLSRANNDLNNLLAGTGIATIFVDLHLRILRFTPTTTRIINLIPGDVGRPVGHIVSNLSGYDSITADTRAVMDTLEPFEIEVQTESGAWFLMRILPYRTLENIIEGAVITFVDIDLTKKALIALAETESRLRRLDSGP